MLKDRTLELLEEMLLIHSPSKDEVRMAEYVVEFLKKLDAEIYLDESQHTYGGNSPVVFARIKGNLDGEGVTLNAHTDVIQPNDNLQIIKTENIWKTDGKTTLGGDDKAGLAAILASVEYIVKNNINHKDIYIIVTPGEEQGMLGAKNINWPVVYEHINPCKNMIVVDNAGKSNKVAYQAPTCYTFNVEITGLKAHAGIEPEKGINAIQIASQIISELPLLRIDEFTTANISTINADFPSNVVPDKVEFTGEIRAHSKDKALEIIDSYEDIIQKYTKEYSFETQCDYPVLQSKDNLKFVNELIATYKEIGIEAEAQIIGGGSDANFFAKEDFNAAIIGVGMQKVHTTDEYLEIDELIKTVDLLIKYLTH